MKPTKLKDMLALKKKLLKDKHVLDKEIESIRDKKKMVHAELILLKNNWKDLLSSSKILQVELDDLTSDIKKKKEDGKRGFRMSGLSINIKDKLNEKILIFFNLQNNDKVSRVIIMKQIFKYIKDNNLYKDGDKRFVDFTKSSTKLDELLKLFDIEKKTECFRIQKFRSYLEKFINI